MVWFRGLLAPLPLIGIAAALLLLPAGLACGVWNWPRGWLALAALAIVAKAEKRQPWIDAVGSIFYAAVMAVWFAFIPLDVFRLHLLPAVPGPLALAGGMAMLAGVVLSYGAIGQNRFAAPTIHDQSGDGQRVIDTGLYGLVRHPFYAGMLLVYAGWALALGSYAALIAASFFLIMTLARIVIEEAFLRKALPDYAAYAARVRARLIPYLL